MQHIDITSLPTDLQEGQMLIDIVFNENPDKEQIKTALKQFMDASTTPDDNNTTAFLSIVIAKIFRPKFYHFYLEIEKDFKPSHFKNLEILFMTDYTYLFMNELSQIFAQFPDRDTFLNDDFDSLKQKIATIPGYNFKTTTTSIDSLHRKYSYVPAPYEVESNTLDIAAFFGAVNIFKYLYMNLTPVTDELHSYAIIGANHDIIHIVADQIGQQYDLEDLEYTIWAHEYELSDWIILNYDVFPPIHIAINALNYKAFWFLIKKQVLDFKEIYSNARFTNSPVRRYVEKVWKAIYNDINPINE